MKTRAMLMIDDVKIILHAAEKEAQKNNWQVAISVMDEGGHLLGFIRMDGATPANARIAFEKAHTAAITRRSSKTWEERIDGGRLSMLKMPVLPVQGGLPILVEGYCLGAVGVSGVQSQEDEQIAEAGILALSAT